MSATATSAPRPLDSVQRELLLVTPEGISFHLPLSGPVHRALAWTVDFCIVAGAMRLIAVPLNLLHLVLPATATLIGVLVAFAVAMLYAAALEAAWHGQTIGKRMLGLRVMDAHGLPLTVSQVLARNLMRAVDGLPVAYLAGISACILSRRVQRLGDQVAGTVVVRATVAGEPDVKAWVAGKYNSLAQYPQLALRLCEQATPRQARLLLDALAQRDRLAPRARLALYADLADYFQSLVRFPPEALEALSAEQYLRNLVALLFH